MSNQAPLEIGLLNNMPDAALRSTEQQFARLLNSAAAGRAVRLRLFSLAGIPRGDYARTYMRGTYASAEALASAGLDGLIVTGNEPRAALLPEEPYWPELTQVIDWAADAGPPSVWSCLAAHAAVLHLDGVERQALPAKCSGVFELLPAAIGDPMLAGLPAPARAPHSRLNGLAESDLLASGYTVLTRCGEAGVDAFVRRGARLMLFLQGHPEYGACSLLREYVRDAGRFLRGERVDHPAIPAGYLDADAERAFRTLAERAMSAPDPALVSLYEDLASGAAPGASWRPYAKALYANWLNQVAAEKVARTLDGAPARSRSGRWSPSIVGRPRASAGGIEPAERRCVQVQGAKASTRAAST
jgi:homoserine O-succinyltransferase